MKFYIDDEFKCHVKNDGTMREIDDACFDGKCTVYIEGFRYVPIGEIWIRKDGEVFYGEMITPWKDYNLLETAQSLYEETLVDKERITALEEENTMLMECILEMSEIIYA